MKIFGSSTGSYLTDREKLSKILVFVSRGNKRPIEKAQEA